MPTTPTNVGYDDPPQGWADLASVLGSFSSGQKADRALQGQFTQNYDRLALEDQQDKRAQETDAQKKLAQSNYILQGGSHFDPGSISLNGKKVPLSSYGMGPIAPSDAQKTAAGSLQDQMLKRIEPGGSVTPTPLDTYAKPGLAENIGSYGGVAGGLLGLANKSGLLGSAGDQIKKLLGIGGSTAPTASAVTSGLSGVTSGALTGGAGLGLAAGLGGGAGIAADGTLMASSIPLANAAGATATNAGALGSSVAGGGGGMGVMGTALPLAGIAAGAYGLAKNHSRSLDVGSGALAGGSLGTMIMPGVGTAVGAGIGAGVGALRHAFGGPDSIEKEGRSTASNVFSQIGASATPEEKANAAGSGWANPDEALAYIVMSDALRAKGQPTTQADQWMKQLQDAEKHGGDKVTQAASQISSMMGARG